MASKLEILKIQKKAMIVRRMLILLFVTIGFTVSTALIVFTVSKKFREFVAVQILKTTWPEKIGGNFADTFFQIQTHDIPSNSELFSKMGHLLDSFKTEGYSASLNEEFCQLHCELKNYYEELKAANAPAKRLRSISYQADCIGALIEAFPPEHTLCPQKDHLQVINS